MKNSQKNIKKIVAATAMLVGVTLTGYAYLSIDSFPAPAAEQEQNATSPTSEMEPEVILLFGVGLISLAVSSRKGSK